MLGETNVELCDLPCCMRFIDRALYCVIGVRVGREVELDDVFEKY